MSSLRPGPWSRWQYPMQLSSFVMFWFKEDSGLHRGPLYERSVAPRVLSHEVLPEAHRALPWHTTLVLCLACLSDVACLM